METQILNPSKLFMQLVWLGNQYPESEAVNREASAFKELVNHKQQKHMQMGKKNIIGSPKKDQEQN